MATVFISSRMDELALERRAAYEAIARARHAPLSFDAALTKLSDSNVSPPPWDGQEQRVSGRRELREQHDTLIDNSEFFLGIYEAGAGEPEYSLHWLSWIEYELVRFLLGRDMVEKRKSKGKPPRPSRELTRRVSKKLREDSERAKLLESIASKKGMQKLLRERCLLVWKREPGGVRASTDLSWFLSCLRTHLKEVRTTRNRVSSGEYLFVPSDVSLFEMVTEWCHGCE